MSQTDPATASWHLDKRVPLSLIAALVVQTLVIANSLTTKSLQIDDHEKRLVKFEEYRTTTDAAINDWVRRAAQRQMQLDEYATRLNKMESRDLILEQTISAVLQQIGRIDERTAQLIATINEMRGELRAARERSPTFQPK
jgi:chromosome segregation ATPase